jgi:3-deoxy-D-arabino-heptulosonate 7-phosphate (DAHP) synthase
MKQTDNLKIDSEETMITPKKLKEKYNAGTVNEYIDKSRKIISDIIN